MSGVKTSVRRVSVRYVAEVEVYGAPERKRKYAKHSIIPDLLVISYDELASGWTVASVTVYGARVIKDGTGARFHDNIWTGDLPNEEQWVRDAVRAHQPTGSLR